MANSTNERPQKPHKDFPLFPHRNGQWAKKIRGDFRYFGVWADPAAALAKYLAEKDYLIAGQEPPPRHQADSVVTVVEMTTRFLEAKDDQVAAGDLSPRSYNDYVATCRRLEDVLGQAKPVDVLTPNDFRILRAELARKRNPNSLANELRRIRVVFNWGVAADVIDAPKYGPDFNPPSKRAIRQHRQQSAPRLFTPQRARALAKYAEINLRAMVMLGLNCGWGNHDVATAPMRAFDLSAGFVDFPRPKTAIARRAPLWPETIDALKAVRNRRPCPEDRTANEQFFLTKHGAPYVRQRPGGAWVDSVGLVFGKLLRKLLIKQPGVNFYALRHTFRTIADEVNDPPAVDLIMGHETPGVGTAYREWTRDSREFARLAAVTEHVRAWYKGT